MSNDKYSIFCKVITFDFINRLLKHLYIFLWEIGIKMHLFVEFLSNKWSYL